MERVSLIELLEKNLKDPRRQAGKSHDVTTTVLLALMATMSGMLGYRAIGDFIEGNRAALLHYLKPRKNRLPSFDTVRRVLQALDSAEVASVLRQWACQHEQWRQRAVLGVDGKALCSTAQDFFTKHQDFVATATAYAQASGITLALASYQNGKKSEMEVVRLLLESLDLHGYVVTADALHCQKKRSQALSNVVVTM
jgi:hypothetical protein